MSIIGRAEIHQYEDDIGGGFCLGSENESPPRGPSHLLTPCTDKEKRIRREIANSNERRRMQSINAGFQSLRTLLPHHEGEKLSKAAILQQTAEYIYALEQEKTRLLAQNCQLKRLIEHDRNEGECTVSKKRKTESGVVVVESTEEGLTEDGIVMDPEDSAPLSPGTNQELIDIRIQLDRERGLRLLLEEKIRAMQGKLYPDRIREITHQVQVQYETEEVSNAERGDGLDGYNLYLVDLLWSLDIIWVERIPGSPTDDNSSCNSEDGGIDSSVSSVPTPLPRSKVFIASASRPNLETIVEAIRHLEGDNLFEDSSETQDVPLALTKHESNPISPYLFHQQQRPGVIVVKHS
ncbi:transcription factor AP-4 [Diaphorina citri]|uniref:Transcription factor AP-4 n=1 Tax=Diaphorina citri TaxID=121845 RepID=A0A3Q0IWR3_DIACI|nr:transcription factor AP-4 [Diaphorina citri]